jgi:hypothetical protein
MATANYVAVFPEVRRDDTLCRVHAPGCADIAKDLAKNGGFEDAVDLDLDGPEAAIMLALDPDELGYTLGDVALPRCATNHANKARRAEHSAKAVARDEQAKAADKRPERPAKATRARKAPATPAPDPQPATTPRRARSKSHGQVVATRTRRNGPAQAEARALADEIIAKATADVKAKGEKVIMVPGRETPVGTPESAVWAAARLASCDDEIYALAVEVRKLRAAGEAWWRIAHTLELPGSGPSVAQGKTGAAHARRLWTRAWGNTYSDTTVPRETKETKKERALVSPGKPFFPSDTPDTEVIAVVQGREITWTTRLSAGDGVVVSLQQAKVSPERIRMEVGPKGRVINFFELVKDERNTEMVGPRRSVYLERIEKVGA